MGNNIHDAYQHSNDCLVIDHDPLCTWEIDNASNGAIML